jgi:2-oxoglutarate dehydrogenase complex dehydrogenase (E1) component-like enzyme
LTECKYEQVNTDAVDTCRLLKDYPAKVDLSVFGLENVDLNRRFNLSSEFLAHTKTHWTVMEVVEFMRESYCGSIGVEVCLFCILYVSYGRCALAERPIFSRAHALF